MSYEQTASGLLVPSSARVEGVERSDKDALARHYQGMAKMEKIFPGLVKMAIMVGRMIEGHSSARGIAPAGVILDVAKWYPDGLVTVAVDLDPEAKRDTANDGAMQNFTNLADLNKHYPQAVELAMSLAFQLTAVINNKKLTPEQISFTRPKWNGHSGGTITFRVLASGLPMGAPLGVRF